MNDFWRVIWKENTSTIVMLTNLVENGLSRCEQYWPSEEGHNEAYGSILVIWKETDKYANFCVRKFLVKKNVEVRTLVQIHYTAFTDIDVPSEPFSITEVIKYVKRVHDGKQSPILVHCSAGIGRTGTFISIYCLMEVIKARKEINIFKFVETARRNRVNMVQTELHYGFIFECLVDFCQTRHTEISTGYLSERRNASRTVRDEFKLLKKLTAHNNLKTKNYQTNPNDFSGRIGEMSESTTGSSDYVNTTLYRSVRKQQAFITTKSPMINTVEDFWRMVYDWRCPIIVMLNQLDKTYMYWPAKGTIKYRNMEVILLEQKRGSTHIMRTFNVSHRQSENALTVHQLQLFSWPAGEDFRALNEIRECIRLLNKQHEMPGPTLVHCINGIGNSSIFVAVEMALIQLEIIGTVDVFSVVRQMRHRNVNAIKTEEDYAMCYKILSSLVLGTVSKMNKSS
ncbi:receptor-type tyrosine-protein phosphatase epsilon-like [Apostichopus japonicus]|uniref:receptor-type tyrosine-protein phosphatase epsilon-like n=1 Tax=Stichopus japonicus TaxID=307972 RepID=UPI003AB915B2